MSDTPFRPFDSTLDPDAALRVLRDTVSGGHDGELFLERKRSETLVFDDGNLKNASFDAGEGFGLRAINGETAAYAHSSEISMASLNRAAETARLAIGAGGGTLADAPAKTNQRLYTEADPITDAPFALKVETLKEIDDFARGLDSRVVQVSATLGASRQEVEILRPEGGILRDVRPMTILYVS
ncbi:MAG TPA: metalloprotease TldD, partial [Rhodobacteraceae bacterium]|nr:metalloprotease TldD [Paracoccaceae bacterium]